MTVTDVIILLLAAATVLGAIGWSIGRRRHHSNCGGGCPGCGEKDHGTRCEKHKRHSSD